MSKISLDQVEELQAFIKSHEWQNDNEGALVSKALIICAKAGASIDEALNYLEIADNERAGWLDYMATRYAAATLGRKGGSVKSPAKSRAAKARNAKRKAEGKPEGGRPKNSCIKLS